MERRDEALAINSGFHRALRRQALLRVVLFWATGTHDKYCAPPSMPHLYGPLSLVMFVAASAVVGASFVRQGRVAALTIVMVAFGVAVTVSGVVLSALAQLANPVAWSAAALASLLLALLGKCWLPIPPVWLYGHPAIPATPEEDKAKGALENGEPGVTRALRLMLVMVLPTAGIVALVGAGVAALSLPHNSDSMTYHLARVAYFLQNGSLAHYDANYWAQITHPRNSAILLAYTYIATSGSLSATQFVQYVAHLFAACSVLGISRLAGAERIPAVLAALIVPLLPIVFTEATSTQNDLVITAWLAAFLFSVLHFGRTGAGVWLAVAGACFGLAAGTKESFALALPSCALVTLAALATRNFGIAGGLSRLAVFGTLRDGAILAGFAAAGFLVLALPSGYAGNLLRYGHLLGPPEVVAAHAFAGLGLREVLSAALANAARFVIEFSNLDGLQGLSFFEFLSDQLRDGLHAVFSTVGLAIDTAPSRVADPMGAEQAWMYPISHEDFSYFGIWGIGIIVPVLAVGLLRRQRGPGFSAFAGACAVFFAVQALAGPFDPFRGRYFLTLSIFALPAFALALPRVLAIAPLRPVLVAMVLLGCVSSLWGTSHRANTPLRTIGGMGWIEQLMLNRAHLTGTYRGFDRLVPAGATVLVALDWDTYEFPLFGEGLSRRLVPVPTEAALQAALAHGDADYFFFNRLAQPEACDVALGNDFFLRPLKGKAREACILLRYRSGLAVSFADGGGPGNVRTSGFSSIEPWGTWTDGAEARLAIPIALDERACDLDLVVTGIPFLAPGHAIQRMEVYVNDMFLAVWEFTTAERPERRQVRIPAALAGSGPMLDIAFHLKDAVAPSAVGLSTDARRLGVGVVKVELLPPDLQSCL